MNKKPKLVFTREEMFKMNVDILKSRGVNIQEIADITHQQQSRYTSDISMKLCFESVEKVLTYRDTFHFIHLACEIDRLAEEGLFRSPIQDIIYNDLGLFGIDETLGLDLAGLYGTIGQTNFGDIDVNKVGVIKRLDKEGKEAGKVQTFLDDIIGAIAAAASTRVAQVINEELAGIDQNIKKISIFDFEDDLK
ncbi:MAG TPA: phosphatidylglycerophosphatase A [Acholeplasmataceae bacterium]|nr:phosphatidylglycerophosphatase A [Acholeplasmataceae bacterium]